MFTTTLTIGYFWSIPTALACLLIGLALAGTIMWVKRSSLKSVRFQRAACDYVRKGSFHLTSKSDNFLFANTTRIPRQQSSPGGGRRRR